MVAGGFFERGGFDDTRELTAIAPNTSIFDGNNQRTPRFSLRGFRENNFLIGEPTVALYVDDVPFTDVASRERCVVFERLEGRKLQAVLRGIGHGRNFRCRPHAEADFS